MSRSKIFALLFSSLLIFSNQSLFAHDSDDDHHQKSAIASVNGVAITKEDIKAKPGDTALILNKRLALAIKRAVYNQTAKNFHVSVSDEEINDAWEKITKGAGGSIDNGARVGIEAMLTENKLNIKINEEIGDKDHNFAKYLFLVKNNPKSPEIQKIIFDFEKTHKATVLNYVQAQRFLWWSERYKKADINIIDKSFVGALAFVNP